jgi:hypothetical protein
MGSDSEALIGTWRLVSCFMEDVETKEQKPVWGEYPNGVIVLTSGGRWIVVQTAEGRKAPQIDEDRAAAFRSMLAYSGKYRTEGNKITEQVRYYRIEGDRLHIEAAPQPYANLGGRVMRGILIWTREM